MLYLFVKSSKKAPFLNHAFSVVVLRKLKCQFFYLTSPLPQSLAPPSSPYQKYSTTRIIFIMREFAKGSDEIGMNCNNSKFLNTIYLLSVKILFSCELFWRRNLVLKSIYTTIIMFIQHVILIIHKYTRMLL